MAFTNKLFAGRREAKPLDWHEYESPESFAIALCLAGVTTEQATVMLREALTANEELRQRHGAEHARRRQQIETEERRRDAAFAAASKLLAQVGYRSDW